MPQGRVSRRPWSRPGRARGWRPAIVRGASAAAGLVLAALVWAAGPAVWRAVRAHPYFRVTTIEVEGNARLSRADVLAAAGLAEGMSAWEAVPHRIRLRLESTPWVERAAVRRDFPGRLAIRLRERRPAAIAQLDGLRYVDRYGRVLGPLRDDDSRDFVIITGLAAGEGDAFAAIGLLRAARLLRLCERLACFEAISEIHVARRRGITVYPARPPVAVTLGWGGWREKLARSARVLAVWEGQAERLALVDVSFRDQVIVRLRSDDRPVTTRSRKRGLRV